MNVINLILVFIIVLGITLFHILAPVDMRWLSSTELEYLGDMCTDFCMLGILMIAVRATGKNL